MPATAASTRAAVPFLDLAKMHAPLRSRILDDVAALIDSGAFTLGARVESFERAFAEYCRASECVGLASGLDALRLALIASGIEQGDEVVVPAATFVATFEAVTQAGGTPVVADISADDYGLDAAAVDAAVTSRTQFVIPVHLYGQLADVRALEEMAARHGLAVVEDACQAHGAVRDGRGAGDLGAAAYSFYPGKNLGGFGDGGALTTNDSALAERVRALREHGQVAKYRHDMEGWTARLDAIQAVVLERKLRELDGWNTERRAAAAFYAEALDGVGDLVLPPVPEGSGPVWHLYVVRTADPAALGAFLAGRGIATGRHYPEPPHLSPAYARLGYREGAFPVAEALSRECLSLPLFPGITDEQLELVAGAIRSYF
ncbi:MAG TPA: DegT/DnrJ/EryC1/StrS family aminotransferase [Gaiellaceae bacterium]